MCILKGFLVTAALIGYSVAEIYTCQKSTTSKVCKDVENELDYVAENPPLPFPVEVEIVVNVIEILEVNKEKQTVTLKLKLSLFWVDKRLTVIRSSDDIKKYLSNYLHLEITKSKLVNFYSL